MWLLVVADGNAFVSYVVGEQRMETRLWIIWLEMMITDKNAIVDYMVIDSEIFESI